MTNSKSTNSYESINIYDLEEQLLDQIISRIETGIYSNIPPINLKFSRLLRSIEINPSTFCSRLQQRKMLSESEVVSIFTKVLRLFLIIFDKTGDIRFLNCVLKLLDFWSRNFCIPSYLYPSRRSYSKQINMIRKLASDRLLSLNRQNIQQKIKIVSKFMEDKQIESFIHELSPKIFQEEVVIFCPNVRSLYTLCVAELLRRSGIRISAIVVKRVFSISRISSEVKRDGAYWLLKKFSQRYLFRSFSENFVADRSLAHMARSLQVDTLDVVSWAQDTNIKVIHTDDFNSKEIESLISAIPQAVGVFTGGGLIRKNIINILIRGIINCHGGILPAYRGLDVEKWAVLENQLSAIGCCAHLMNEAVDEGGILIQYRSKLKGSLNIEKLGYNLEFPQCVVLVNAVLGYLGGQLEPVQQEQYEGRQFFYMHRSLVKIVRVRLMAATNIGAC